jgi:acetyl esterase
MTPQQARDWHNRKAGILDVKPEPVFKTSDRSVPGPAGAFPFASSSRGPATKPLPVLVWLHGGGHVVGSLDSYDALCRQLALQGDCVVVRSPTDSHRNTNFRRVEDSFAALQWVAEHAIDLAAIPSALPLAATALAATSPPCARSSPAMPAFQID